MKLKIKNFQSISEAEIDFPKGITVIQGESNNGKTAILRAVKAIVTNPAGSSSYIKHGKKSAVVEMTNNGETLTWTRTKSSVSYRYHDEDYPKASKQDSDSFCNLGFIRGSKGELMNMLDEWSVLFPFGYSDAEFFKIFEDLLSIIDSAKVLEGFKGDETSCSKDKLLLQDSLNNLTNRLTLVKDCKSKLKPNQSKMIKTVLNKKFMELEKMKKDLATATGLNKISKTELTSEPFERDCLENIGKQLVDLTKALSRASQLPLNVKVPKIKEFDFSAADYLGKLNQAIIAYQQEQEKRRNLIINQAELEKTLEALDKQWKSIDVCPLCGGEMSHE